MASASLVSSHVELHGSEITKPKPLRIVKRGQTVTGSSTPREIVGRGRGRDGSGTSDESKGSSPLGPDRPLTIHKFRRGRGSVLDGSFEDDQFEQHSGSAISDLIKKNFG